jgi:flavin-dependent dehydrogenase
MQQQVETVVDVLIIGAGPAGSAAAALLASAGLSVCVVEKDNFPRFKIGESLLPAGNNILRRLGIWDKMDDAGFMRKYGGEFVSSDGSSRVNNIFSNGLIKDMDYTYQVERAKFDQLLVDNARDKGCTILQPCKVTDTEWVDGLWQVKLRSQQQEQTETSQLQARWLLDGSGRASYYGKSKRLAKDHIPYPKRLAVYSHFSGVKREPARERGGNIIITRLRDGWFWSIPLDKDKTSVGVVSSKHQADWEQREFTLENFFYGEVERSSYLTELMSQAKPIDEFRATGDYSHSFSDYAFPRAMLIGDAASFIDPVFSSGVYLAMRSAELAADAIVKAHQQNRSLSARECAGYTKTLKRNVRVMRDLIEVYYDNGKFSVFMSPTNNFQLFGAVNSIVAGNTSPGFNVWWRFQLFLLICKINKYYRLAPEQTLA